MTVATTASDASPRKPVRLYARALALVLLGACSSDSCVGSDEAGGLVILVETDLTMPKDLNRLVVEVENTTSLQKTRLADVALGLNGVVLPEEFRIEPPGGDGEVIVHAIAYKSSHARVERSAAVAVPSSETALLRLPLNYLCDGTANEDGSSSCGLDQTCNQGICASTVLTDLPSYTGSTMQAATVEGDEEESGGDCFDVTYCFSDALPVELEPVACTWAPPPDVEFGFLNFALELEPNSEGICEDDACWVLLEPGELGWTFDGQLVILPLGVCYEPEDNPRFTVMVSTACATKAVDWAACSRATGVASMDPTTDQRIFDSACVGPAAEPCENCGTRKRECKNGSWSAWGECTGSGICRPDELMECGDNGMNICNGECSWGGCVGQGCVGANAEACENCGVRYRECDNGTWGEWSACVGQGVCGPNDTQECAAGGTQACGGTCEWGGCGGSECGGGAPSEACGLCGTRTRACDVATGQWGAWSECIEEAECAPNQTRPCGMGGTQTCGGNCQWDPTCREQVCIGQTERSCGNCGVQRRECDDDTGEWGEWSECSDGGECAPGEARDCGDRGGTQFCGGNCQWDDACLGQTCSGPSSRACGNCGRQSRLCDRTTGQWFPWSDCSGQGECVPGTPRDCTDGSSNQEHCTNQCLWNNVCCASSLTACRGACIDTRTDPNNCGGCGNLACDSGQCSGGNCVPLPCSGTGQMMCGGSCIDTRSDPENCGDCGVECPGQCASSACVPVISACNGPGQMLCGSQCVDTRLDPDNCGDCGTQCPSGQCAVSVCIPAACPPGQDRCTDNGPCVTTGTDQNCARCGDTCADNENCANGSCLLARPTPCPAGQDRCTETGPCVQTGTDQNCSECGHSCDANQDCVDGFCAVVTTTAPCPSGQDRCTDTGLCVQTGTDQNCSECGDTCADNENCANGSCLQATPTVCPPGQDRCIATGPCVQTGTDENCSECGDTCADNENCANGSCLPASPTACPAGQDRCTETGPCVQTGTDQNCSECGDSCDANQDCVDGFCAVVTTTAACPSGQDRCTDTGLCVQTGTDQNCSECGDACDANQDCVDGFCAVVTTTAACPSGQDRCTDTGLCVQTGTAQNCSECGDVCGSSQSCVSGRCMAPRAPSIPTMPVPQP